MSGVPFFLSGANAKILIGGKTVAYATDVTYSISVKHGAPRLLGKFEVESIQPLEYNVSGTLTVIKYGKGLASTAVGGPPPSVSDKGNGVGGFEDSNGLGPVRNALGINKKDKPNNEKNIADSFNPATMFQSEMFDIEIRQKIYATVGHTTKSLVPTLKKKRYDSNGKIQQSDLGYEMGTSVQTETSYSTGIEEVPTILLRDCRFTDQKFSLSKKGLAVLELTFRARYAHDDTKYVGKSGVGQELS